MECIEAAKDACRIAGAQDRFVAYLRKNTGCKVNRIARDDCRLVPPLGQAPDVIRGFEYLASFSEPTLARIG